jgi:hypothetical protein
MDPIVQPVTQYGVPGRLARPPRPSHPCAPGQVGDSCGHGANVRGEIIVSMPAARMLMPQAGMQRSFSGNGGFSVWANSPGCSCCCSES